MSIGSESNGVRTGVDEDDRMGGLFAPLPPEPLVSVVMTMFNSEGTLEAGVRSLMEQTYGNLEIILSDDGSSDGTLALARRLCAEDRRISLLQFGGNQGTYWAKNYGVRQSRGQVVTFADSDDTSDPRRIELQLEALRQAGVVVSTCAYSRVDETGAQLPIPGSRGFAFISQMIRRDVLDMVGYFDSARTSADDEMLNRILITFGSGAHSIVPQRLYTATVREGSLSHNKHNPRYSPVTKGLSPPRRAYADGFRAWHARVLESGAVPYMPFPVTSRPFPLDPKLEVRAGAFTRNFISVVAWGSGAKSEPRLLDLARQCERDTTCARSWAEDVGLKGDLWEIHRVSTDSDARAFAASAEFPGGYVLFCDLDSGDALDEFVQQAVMEVEQAGRPAIASLLAASDGALHDGILHGRGCHTDGVASMPARPPATQAPREDSPAGGSRPGRFTPGQLPATEADAVESPGRAAALAGSGRTTRAWRDGVSLLRQFLGLWSRSEQVIALLLGVGLAVMVLGLVMPWSWVSTLGMAGVLGGVGIAVLLNTRRTRLLADPALQVDSHQRLSGLASGLGAFRQAYIGGGAKVLPTPAVPTSQTSSGDPALTATTPPSAATPASPAPAGELRLAILQMRGLSAPAGLAKLARIQARYSVSPDIGHALSALRLVLLAQAGRMSVAEGELARISREKGAAARKWSDHGRAWLQTESPLEEVVEQIINEIAGGLEAKP